MCSKVSLVKMFENRSLIDCCNRTIIVINYGYLFFSQKKHVSNVADISFSGMQDLFTTPVKSSPVRGRKSVAASPYSDLPPTPQGPGEMVVSPVTSAAAKKQLSSRKNQGLYGIKRLLGSAAKSPKGAKSPKLSGVKRLMKTPKTLKSPRFGELRNYLLKNVKQKHQSYLE